jgi:hypothetical protein
MWSITWRDLGGGAEAAAELLQPEDAGLGGAEHEDGVDRGEVDGHVEDVHVVDDVKLSRLQLLQRPSPQRTPLA